MFKEQRRPVNASEASTYSHRSDWRQPEPGKIARKGGRRPSRVTRSALAAHHRDTAKNLGVPARDAQLILGHSRLAVTLEIYTHEDRAAQREALGRISDALGHGSANSAD